MPVKRCRSNSSSLKATGTEEIDQEDCMIKCHRILSSGSMLEMNEDHEEKETTRSHNANSDDLSEQEPSKLLNLQDKLETKD